MPQNSRHGRRTLRRTAARLATAAAAAALLATGVTGGATAQSSDLASTATTTHGNLTVTHEVVGGNVGLSGDTINLRTTVSATDGPVRQITGISETVSDYYECYRHWTNKRSASVTYTNAAGERVTDSMPTSSPGAGSWTVDPVAGTTVVYDSVRRFQYAPIGTNVGCAVGQRTAPINMGTRVVVTSDGLDPLDWNPTGVTLTCLLDCNFFGPGGSVEESFGS